MASVSYKMPYEILKKSPKNGDFQEMLGRKGSNLRMGASKAPALPLGYSPMVSSFLLLIFKKLCYYFPAEDAEGVFYEGVIWIGFLRGKLNREAGRCPENGSKCLFDGQAAFGLLETFFVKGMSHGDADSATFRELRRATGE